MIKFIGDIHGNFTEYAHVASQVDKSVQIGDFGIGFYGPYWHEQVNKFHASGNHRFIRGNHDSPNKCKSEMVGYIPDGTVENNIMYIGGAYSIDQRVRTEGVTWWADEECSTEEFYTFFDVYNMIQPEIMVTHDIPQEIANFIVSNYMHSNHIIGTKTGQAFDSMFQAYQPKLWIFGHWHIDLDFTYNGTRFICLSELSYIDINPDHITGVEVIYPW